MIPCPIRVCAENFDTQPELAFHLQRHPINDLVLEIMYLLDILNGRRESK